MGLDYIRRETKRPWTKRWKNGLDRLKTPTLFDFKVDATSKPVMAALKAGAGAKVGDTYVIEPREGRYILSRGLHEVGELSKPAPEIISALAKCGGFAAGYVQSVGLFGDMAELSLR